MLAAQKQSHAQLVACTSKLTAWNHLHMQLCAQQQVLQKLQEIKESQQYTSKFAPPVAVAHEHPAQAHKQQSELSQDLVSVLNVSKK
jgi:hypothetical protein